MPISAGAFRAGLAALLLAACHPTTEPAADDQRQLNDAAASLDANAAPANAAPANESPAP